MVAEEDCESEAKVALFKKLKEEKKKQIDRMERELQQMRQAIVQGGPPQAIEASQGTIPRTPSSSITN